ncbi:MAG: hypothetical protein JNM67_00990, partial [Bacteroidetes bacterium]|nr:hypothetical protein [Bacteroidota bacterium]
HLSFYNFVQFNPLIYVDPDGKDATCTLVDNVITVKAMIFVSGTGITQDKINDMQNSINSIYVELGSKAVGAYNTAGSTGYTTPLAPTGINPNDVTPTPDNQRNANPTSSQRCY